MGRARTANESFDFCRCASELGLWCFVYILTRIQRNQKSDQHILELLGPSWGILEPSWAILDYPEGFGERGYVKDISIPPPSSSKAGPMMDLRGPKMGPRWPKMATRLSEMAPRWPKIGPRWLKIIAARCFQMFPKYFSDSHFNQERAAWHWQGWVGGLWIRD